MIGKKDTKKELKKKDDAAQCLNLINFVIDAKDKAKVHWEQSKDAYQEYLRTQPVAQTASQQMWQTKNFYPIFWQSVKNLLPAYYSRTPNTLAKRLFDSEDPVGKVAAQLIERLSKALLHKNPLDLAMTHASTEFVLTDKATVRIHCEEELEVEPQEVEVLQNQDTGEFMTQDGMIIPVEQIQQLPDGRLVSTIEAETVKEVCIPSLPVNYDDIIHTPNARNWTEIKTIGLRIYLDKHEFIERFGKEKLDLITFTSKKDDDDKSPSTTSNNSEKGTNCVELWEIWDKTKKMVYVVSLNCKTQVIDEYEDPYDLKGFFPVAPFVISTKPSRNLYPTPMYIQLKPIILQLHRLFNRICKMTSALRRRGIADAQLKDVIDQINGGDDFELMASKNYAQILERGGLQNAILWLPLKELSEALVEAQGMQQQFEAMFNQLSGVPDVVRGNTSPNETASAQQQKGQFYNLRTSWDQLQFQEMARYVIEMQIEIALKKMPIDMLKKYMGVQYLDEADKPYVEQALQVLLNDDEMEIRVEIETDSMSYMNDKQNQADRAAAGQIVIQGLQQVAGAQNPAMAIPIAQVLFATLRAQSMGKDFENTVAEALKKMEEMANQPPAPPPVDPNVEFNQAKIQIEQQKLQLQQQKDMADNQLEQIRIQNEANTVNMEMEFKVREAEAKAQQTANEQFLAQSKLELESQVANLKYEIDSQRVQIEASATQNEAQLIILKQQLESTQSEFDKFLKVQDVELRSKELEIEDKKITLSEAEKQQEEKRLATQQQLEMIKMQHENQMQDKTIAHEKEIAEKQNKARVKKISIAKDDKGTWNGTSEES